MLLKISKGLASLASLIFLASGIGWHVAPEFAAGQLGMTLLAGVGLSSQIGDLASFFLTMGVCIAVGLRTRNALWFWPPAMMLGFAAAGRTLAWSLHGAAFAADLILVEVILASVMIYLTRNTGGDGP